MIPLLPMTHTAISSELLSVTTLPHTSRQLLHFHVYNHHQSELLHHNGIPLTIQNHPFSITTTSTIIQNLSTITTDSIISEQKHRIPTYTIITTQNVSTVITLSINSAHSHPISPNTAATIIHNISNVTPHSLRVNITIPSPPLHSSRLRISHPNQILHTSTE